MNPTPRFVSLQLSVLSATLALLVPSLADAGITVESNSLVRQTFINNNARNIGACLAEVDLSGDGTLRLVVGAPGTRNPAGTQNVGRTLPINVDFGGQWQADPDGIRGSPSGDVGNAKFGFRCDSEGSRLVVSQTINVRAHVYDGEQLAQTLTPILQSPLGLEAPNAAVAIRDGIVALGVPNDDGGRGRVHLWRFDDGAWLPLQILDAGANAVVNGQFGWSLALGTGLLVVGAPAETAFGRAYAFRRHDVTGLFELTAELPVPSQFNAGVSSRFGSSVAVDEANGAHLAVAAVDAQMQGLGAVTGGVAIYRALASAPSGWTPLYGLAPPDGTNAQQFGFSLDLRGDQLLVGDPENLSAGSVGAAYRFWMSPDFGSLRRIVKYFQPGSLPAQNFAWDLRLVNGAVVVGVPGTFSTLGTQSVGQAMWFGEANGVFRDGLEPP